MVFDTVLAFDHVKHRILAIANARLRPGEDLRALYDFACAKIDFLERELERNLSRTRRPPPAELTVTPNQTREQFEDGVRTIQERHRGRRGVSGGVCRSASTWKSPRRRSMSIARFAT